MRITISGPPGSGKTTLATLVSQKTGYRLICAGEIFRNMAKEREMSLEDFGRLAEQDDSIDRELDRRMVEIARESDNIVLDGRLTGFVTRKEGIDAFRVYVTADFPIRVERIAKREKKDKAVVEREVLERERSEYERYRKYYGFDIRDTSIYDLVLDSSHMSPDALAEKLLHEAGVKHAHQI